MNAAVPKFGEGLGPGRARPYRVPTNWRARLALLDTHSYFRTRLVSVSAPNPTGWASARCPFHEDRNASLSILLKGDRGGWRCHAGCGSGDLVGFHRKLTGLGFAEAVRELLAQVGS